jgi:hypothetical protein
MKIDDIPVNSIILKGFIQKDGRLGVELGHNFEVDTELSDGLDEESILYLLDVLMGIRITLDAGLELFAQQGAMARTIEDLSEELGDQDIIFEPDEELKDVLKKSESNVISFNKKRIH